MQSLLYFSISSQLLMKEAEKLGIRVEPLAKEKNLFLYSYKEKTVVFKSVNFGENSLVGSKIADDKELTYIILGKLGYPIAPSIYVQRDDFRKEFFDRLLLPSFPLIIKPLNGAHGEGLMMNIHSRDELKKKLQESFLSYTSMIIQKQITGREFRVLICKQSVILAFYRNPPTVIGNGISSIETLIEIENANPLRGDDYHKPLAFIKNDSELIHHIAQKGYALDSIPAMGTSVDLRGNSNIGTGGTIEEITSTLHPSIKNMCLHIADFMKLGICGIDIMSTDHTIPLIEAGGVILEVNSSPGIGGDRELTSVNTAYEILTRVFDVS